MEGLKYEADLFRPVAIEHMPIGQWLVAEID